MFKKLLLSTIAAVTLCGSNTFALPVSVAGKLISETVETAAKKSGKMLSPAAKKLAAEALETAVKRYGDDALKVASQGGLEAIQCISRYGDDFVRLTSHSPQAARSLALHADELMPIARRIGPDFMKLESKVPGLGKLAVETFGDDAVKTLNKFSADDAAKIIALGGKADSPVTAKLLLQKADKSGGKILKYLDFKRIMGVGLSAAAIIAASKTADGFVEVMKSSPGTAAWGFWGFAVTIIALLVLIYFGPSLLKKGLQKLKKQ